MGIDIGSASGRQEVSVESDEGAEDGESKAAVAGIHVAHAGPETHAEGGCKSLRLKNDGEDVVAAPDDLKARRAAT